MTRQLSFRDIYIYIIVRAVTKDALTSIALGLF